MGIMNYPKMDSYKIDTIRKSTLISFGAILLYKLCLDISYYCIISQVWGHAKFELHLNGMKLFESYFLLLIIFFLMPKSSKKLSNIMIWVMILMSYIPMLTIFSLKNESRLFMYAVSGFWVMIFFIIHLPSVQLVRLEQSKVIAYSFSFCLVIIVCLLIFKYVGVSFNFNLSKVYEVRSQFSAMKVPFAGYLFKWLCYIVNPLFFAVFWVKKKWSIVSVIVFLQLLLFSNTGNKTYLFALFFVFVLIWSLDSRYPLFYMSFGLAVIVIIGMGTYWLFGDVWMSSLFTRRTLLDQPQQYFFYYDFFSKNVHTFLSQHNIFNIFMDYPYELDPPNLIGNLYYGNPKSNANTGLVGDAYMNFGFVGLVIWAIVTGLIMKIIDSCSVGVDLRIGVAVVAMPILGLINSALLTNLLTHGLLLAVLLLYLLPKKVWMFKKT